MTLPKPNPERPSNPGTVHLASRKAGTNTCLVNLEMAGDNDQGPVWQLWGLLILAGIESKLHDRRGSSSWELWIAEAQGPIPLNDGRL